MKNKMRISVALAGTLLIICLILVQNKVSVTPESVSPLADMKGQADKAAMETLMSKEDDKIGKPHSGAGKVPMPLSNPWDKSKPVGHSGNREVTYMLGSPLVWMSDLDASRMPINEFLSKARFSVFDSEKPSESLLDTLSRAGIDYKDSSRKYLIENRIEATEYLLWSISWTPAAFPTAAFETSEHFFFSQNSDPGFSKGGWVIRKKTGEIGFWVVE